MTVLLLGHAELASTCPVELGINLVKLFIVLSHIKRDNYIGHSPLLLRKETQMEMNQIALSVGRSFAHSEIEADKALEDYARGLGDNPSFEKYEHFRLSFIAGYVEVKTHVKGDAADQAFKRFKDRLCNAFGIDVPVRPKSENPNAVKKQAERKAKVEALLEKYEDTDLPTLHDQLSAAYEIQAKNPMKKNKDIGELETVVKERMKDTIKNTKDALKDIKKELRQAISECDDIEVLTEALGILQ
jgi:hypothetical protein